MNQQMPPKLFISYSWTNPTHEEWVIQLATDLREASVDVILDKWDLKEGHDAIAFMEQMVTDTAVAKVLMVCDAAYASKADKRAGGVGTESQIISREVYEKTSQDKFVAVVTEKDAEGKPCVPVYYKSRIHIDLSEPDTYIENFEKLLRWVFDKPLHVKPPLGKMPGFLSEQVSTSLGTSTSAKRAIEAFKNSRPYATGALDEYLNLFAENLERFRIVRAPNVHYDETLLENIESFIPYRNEMIQVFAVVCQYSLDGAAFNRLHRFFEQLIPYLSRPESQSSYSEYDYDNFKFVVHELFLYALAIFLKHEKFDAVNSLLGQHYYVAGNSDYGRDELVRYRLFRDYLKSLEARNQRLGLKRTSLRADLLKERSNSSGVGFRDLMQADFVAYVRGELGRTDWYTSWWPETLLYLGHFNGPFEIFARATSRSYFQRMKAALGIDQPGDLESFLVKIDKGEIEPPRWQFTTLNPKALLGYEKLCTQP